MTPNNGIVETARTGAMAASAQGARPILTWSNVIVIAVFLVMLLTSLVGMNHGLTMAPVPGVN